MKGPPAARAQGIHSSCLRSAGGLQIFLDFLKGAGVESSVTGSSAKHAVGRFAVTTCQRLAQLS